MVNTLACTGARSAAASPSPIPRRQALAWIKRRASRLQAAFSVSRCEALSAARSDWAAFQPASAL